jgi:alpha-glucosidase
MKNVFRRILLFIFVFTFVITAQEQKTVHVIKVACIGNSITYGAGIENREFNSYPAVLGRLLGGKYEVINFGLSGRTALRKGDTPYLNEKKYKEALDYNPDIVIIKLGTNDSKQHNWKYKNEFEKDYSDLVDSFLNLSSHPKVFICRPVPAYNQKFGIRDSIITTDIIPMVEKIAKEKNLEVIDLYKALSNKANLFPDGIHPNAEGASEMAKEICKAITSGKEYNILSPNKKLELKVNIGYAITYSLFHSGNELIQTSKISMTLDNNQTLGTDAKVIDAKTITINEILKPVVKQKYEKIIDNCTELTLTFDGNYALIFRVYNDGIAYRFHTDIVKEIKVGSEQAEFNFGKDYKMYFPEETSLHSHSEREYFFIPISQVTPKRFCSLPALVELDNGIKAAITEADLEDYCGMYLTGSENNSTQLVAMFPKYPAKDSVKNDRNLVVTKRENYLAKTFGKRDFPWRVVVISEKDGDLIESTMIYKLAKPTDKNLDFSWVKPGKVAWDWWNANNIYKVDFRAGINNNTYKYYIDFASKYGIDYIILDEGWYKLGNILQQNPDINVEELVAYGNKKHVGIILWVSWLTLNNQLEEALNQYEKWGVKGVKVDFMQRDDQWMVNYYYKVAREAAKRKLLVDFHGAYKPTGLYRTFPNVITNEGVRGLENDKWSEEANPLMAVTIPFIRMFAGPVDYTPGAMINGTKKDFKAIYNEPMSMGTRCHQLAMYVNYESPLQMLADNPTNYYREPECMEFLSKVPTVWDDTKVLDAKVSEYLLTARRNGSKWFIGAMTNWTPRDLTIDFSFLPEGKFKITIWQDGINADRNAMDYKKISQTVDKNTKLNIHLAPGGGWAGIVSK